MRAYRFIFAAIGLAFAACVFASAATADELRIYAPRAIVTVLDKIGAQFEEKSGAKLVIVSDVTATLLRRINAGESFDIFVGPPTQVDGAIKDGKLVAATRIPLVRSGIGVEVRAGAPKPDISSLEAFKRAMLAATSIGYLKEGTSGIAVARLFDRLGLAEAVKSKLVRPDTDIVSELVAKGEVEIGLVALTQILTSPGVDLVGPLPADIQTYTTFVGAVSSASHAPDTARALLDFLAGPIARPVILSQGMEPGR